MKQFRGALLLTITALIWGTAFVAQSLGMDHLGPFAFNGVRNFIAALALLPVLLFMQHKAPKKTQTDEERKQSRKTLWVGGVLCGSALAVASNLQQFGISFTTVGKAGFLTALYIVIVPILGLFLKKRVPATVWVSVVIAAAGTYLLSVQEGFTIAPGDLLVILCALGFSVHILIIDHFSPMVNGVALSCVQFLVCGVLCTAAALFTETFTLADILKSARMRQDFTANVSHELKTPLTAISGYAELMENGMVPPEEIGSFAQKIEKNARRLLSLINDIIRLSELDSSNTQLLVEKFDLFEEAQICVENMQIYAEKNDVTITYEGGHQEITANREMINELINNLCANAIRYNKKNGSVKVRVDSSQGHPYISVADTGIGISKEHQKRVFERFYRVDKSRSKQTGGTGLGLAIVKHIVALHDAQLNLESEVGKGTTITVTF